MDKRLLLEANVLASAVNKMGKLHSVERSSNGQDLKKSKSLPVLLELCSKPEMKFPNLHQVLQGLGMGKLAARAPQSLLDQMMDQLPVLRPSAITTCLFALAQLGQEDCAPVLDAVERELLQHRARGHENGAALEDFTPKMLVQLVWSFSKLRPHAIRGGESLHQAVAQSLLARGDALKELSLEELVHLVSSYSSSTGGVARERENDAETELLLRCKNELLEHRGGWRALRGTGAFTNMVTTFANELNGHDSTLRASMALAMNDLVRNRNLADFDTKQISNLVQCFTKQLGASSRFYLDASVELMNKHFKSMDFHAITAVLYAYSVDLGVFGHASFFDKASKELVKPKIWRGQDAHAKLLVALANLPPQLVGMPHVSVLVEKLAASAAQAKRKLENDDSEEEEALLVAWALACLGKPLAHFAMPSLSLRGADVRKAQELAMYYTSAHGGGDEFAKLANSQLPPALLERLTREFGPIEHQVDGISVDAYFPALGVIIDYSLNQTLAQQFRSRLLRQHFAARDRHVITAHGAQDLFDALKSKAS